MKRKVTTRTLSLHLTVLGMVCFGTPSGLARRCDAGELQSRPSARANSAARSFAIADFDGDQRPDLATVEVQDGAERVAGYSIRLQMSAGPSLEIAIHAPNGGLRIFSRDVNGDDLEDLVVTAALDSHLVAVLLNDGHGNFSPVRPESYPNLEIKNGPALGALVSPIIELSPLAPTRSSFEVEARPGYQISALLHADQTPLERQQYFQRLCVQDRPGRAPPARVLPA